MKIPTLNAPRTGGNPIPDRVIAAIRWDYECNLLSMAQCVERYSTLVHAGAVRDICARRWRPDVTASKYELLWK